MLILKGGGLENISKSNCKLYSDDDDDDDDGDNERKEEEDCKRYKI